VVVGPHYVVKYGAGVEQIEGETLLFIEQNLRIPAPRLYAMYQDAKGWLYIVMDLIQGETLENLWPNLSEDDKTLITYKLKTMMAQIRSLPSPGFYGSVSKGPVPYFLLWTNPYDRSISGPFENEHDFNMGFVEKLRMIWKDNNRHSYKADYYEKNLPAVLHSHQPVFTHADIQRKNVLVREITANGHIQQRKEFEVVLVDWEEAGWYPSYWEFATKLVAFQWDDGWPKQFEKIVDPWPAEAAILRMMYQDLFY
jgi:aminoglycoside phosphotransferase (APT) family kinase protein